MVRGTDERGGKRNVHICFTPEQLATLENFARKKGMTDHSQAVEYLAMQSS
jgi:hypothetical protein